MRDKIIESIVDKFSQRSDVGFKKYGTTLERDDLTFLQWLTHLQEELMDATAYLEKLKQEISTMSVTRESWENADKITHDGYLYVRCADLSFCK